MKNKFLAVVAAVSAVALVSGILVVTANAHIGASHTPFTTEAPDLRTVAIDGDDLNYCFDEEVSEISGDEFDFWIAGYDTDAWNDATDVDLSNDEANCVIVTFDDTDRDLEDFTVAGVYEDAVQDRQDNENVEASVALDGSENFDDQGDTEAPDLIDWDENEADDEITYMWDEDVEDSCDDAGEQDDAGNYGYYTSEGENGGRVDGNTITDCDGNEVTVDFGTVDDVERVFYDPDQAGDATCTADPNVTCADYNGIGADTNDADLTDVERTDDNQWTFHFDEPVQNPSDDFFLYAEDGDRYGADAGSCDDTESDVECDFDALEDAQDGEIVKGAVDDCAADTDDTAADCVTLGSAPIAGGNNAEDGSTNGPDLESCSLNSADELVTFQMDETIDESSATGDDFDLVDNDGNVSDGGDIDDSDEDAGSITIEFDQDEIDDAVACHVDEYQFTDLLGNDNVLATVGTQQPSSAPPSTTTSTSTSTTTSTVTTGTGHTPVKRKVATNLTIRYDRNDKAFKGSVGSGKKKCQTGRLVKLHKKGVGVNGSDSSNGKGNYRINKRRAKGRYFTDVAKKVYTARNGDTIVCKTDTSPTIKV